MASVARSGPPQGLGICVHTEKNPPRECAPSLSESSSYIRTPSEQVTDMCEKRLPQILLFQPGGGLLPPDTNTTTLRLLEFKVDDLDCSVHENGDKHKGSKRRVNPKQSDNNSRRETTGEKSGIPATHDGEPDQPICLCKFLAVYSIAKRVYQRALYQITGVLGRSIVDEYQPFVVAEFRTREVPWMIQALEESIVRGYQASLVVFRLRQSLNQSSSPEGYYFEHWMCRKIDASMKKEVLMVLEEVEDAKLVEDFLWDIRAVEREPYGLYPHDPQGNTHLYVADLKTRFTNFCESKYFTGISIRSGSRPETRSTTACIYSRTVGSCRPGLTCSLLDRYGGLGAFLDTYYEDVLDLYFKIICVIKKDTIKALGLVDKQENFDAFGVFNDLVRTIQHQDFAKILWNVGPFHDLTPDDRLRYYGRVLAKSAPEDTDGTKLLQSLEI